nr:MAG TPA: TNFRSF17 necrosis factor receptor superfamily member [Caudoviricetes sp.]
MRISENVVFWICIGIQVLALILALLIYIYGGK